MYDGSTTGCRMRRWVGHRFLLSTFLMAMAAGCTAVPDDATQPGEAAAALPFEPASIVRQVTQARGAPGVLPAPVIGAEEDPSAPVVGAAPGTQSTPSVASNGTMYLVTWLDQADAEDRIWAARVDSAGSLLDDTGFEIATGGSGPVVAASDDDFLVAWQRGNSIVGRKVPSSGEPEAAFTINSYGSTKSHLALGANGNGWLAAWTDNRGADPDIYGAWVSDTLTVSPTNGQAIAEVTGSSQYRPAVTAAGAKYLVAWRDDRNSGTDVYASCITGTGGTAIITPASGVALSTDGYLSSGPAVASNGTDFLAVWGTLDTTVWVYGSGVRAVGGASCAPGATTYQLAPGASADTVSVAGIPSGYVALWREVGGDIMGRQLDPQGSSLTLAQTAADGPSVYEPRVAAAGTSLFFVWQDGVAWDIMGTPYVGGSLGTTATVSRSANRQTEPSVGVAEDGTRLLVWVDHRTPSDLNLRGALLRTSGQVTELVLSGGVGTPASPHVVSDGTNFGVTWREERTGTTRVYFARVSSTGVVSPAGGTPISPAGTSISSRLGIAYGGGKYAVVWLEPGSGSCDDVIGARIDAATAAVTGLVIDQDTTCQADPAVAASGSDFLVAWSQPGGSGGSDIFAREISSTGSGTPTFRVGAGPVTDTSSQSVPSVAAGGDGQYLVVWEHDGSGSGDIGGALVDVTGATPAITEDLLVATFRTETSPRVIFDGSAYYLTWTDESGSGTLPRHGAWLTSAHNLTGKTTFGDGFLRDEGVALASDRRGRIAVAYSHFDPSDGHATQRAVVRKVASGSALGDTCSADGDCASGYCTDGVCCNARCGGSDVDCQACSVAAGAGEDGTCQTAAADSVCRAADGPCDVEESCDGTSAVCPADAFAEAGTTCAIDACETEATCSGLATSCPIDEGSCTVSGPGPGADEPRTSFYGCSAAAGGRVPPAAPIALLTLGALTALLFRRRAGSGR